MSPERWVPDSKPERDNLRRRLSGGAARCRSYGLVRPEHVTVEVMLNKLRQRAAAPAGVICYACGRPITATQDWHIDHVRPLIAYGRHHYLNLEIVHARCNSLKGDSYVYPSPVGDDPTPLLTILRAMDPHDLWSTHRDLARKIFLVPRPVPIDNSIGELTHLHAIVTELRRQPWPWAAMPLTPLAARIGVARGQLDNSFWDKFMGFSVKGHAKGTTGVDHNSRLQPHALIVATRHNRGNGAWGAKAVRLRQTASLDLIDAWLADPTTPLPTPGAPTWLDVANTNQADLTGLDPDVAVDPDLAWADLPTWTGEEL